MTEIQEKNPDWIFFFHWSKIVPSYIHEKQTCVVIHTGNLPRNRGGSPIQNQILEGVLETRVNALQMNNEIDAGDVYCSSPITLQGNLADIWMTISEMSYNLMCKCVDGEYKLQKQFGIRQVYKRRGDNEILFDGKKSISRIYDQIRMMDAEDYPAPYINFKNYRLEFSRAKLQEKEIIADVRIIKV